MTPCLSVAHDLRSSSREERPCKRKHFWSFFWYFSQHDAKDSPLMSLRIPVVSLAAASSRSPLADDAVCQLKDTSKHTKAYFCQTYNQWWYVQNYVKQPEPTLLAEVLKLLQASPRLVQPAPSLCLFVLNIDVCCLDASSDTDILWEWCILLLWKLFSPFPAWFFPMLNMSIIHKPDWSHESTGWNLAICART